MHERNKFQNAVMVIRKGKTNLINMINRKQKLYAETELKFWYILSVARVPADWVTEIVRLM